MSKGFSTMTVLSKDLDSSNSSMGSTRHNNWKIPMGQMGPTMTSSCTTAYRPTAREMGNSYDYNNSSRSKV